MTGVLIACRGLNLPIPVSLGTPQPLVDAGELNRDNDYTPYGLRAALAKHRKGQPAEHDAVQTHGGCCPAILFARRRLYWASGIFAASSKLTTASILFSIW